MAINMLSGKLNDVVAAHNRVHATLSAMSEAAKVLSVQPRLQENKETSAAVAVAVECLGQASTTSSVVLGVNILKQWRNHPYGPKKGLEFLQQHRTSKSAAVPEAFWHVFEHMVDHAAVASAVKVEPVAPVSQEQTSAKCSTTGAVVDSADNTASSSSASASTTPSMVSKRTGSAMPGLVIKRQKRR